MGLTKLFKSRGADIIIWKIDESIEDMIHQLKLTDEELSQVLRYKSLRRQREWLATRLALRHLLKRDVTIDHHESGAPYLIGESINISISHSDRYVAVAVSEKLSIGIDIECTTRDIERVAKRFLSEFELNNINSITDSEVRNGAIFLHWCSKEALFKLIEDTDIEFADQMNLQLKPMDIEGSMDIIFTRNSTSNYTFSLNYTIFDKQMFVWIVE